MKKHLLKTSALILAMILVLALACKSKKVNTGNSKPAANTAAANEKPKSIGKISHEYSASGCGTVVIISGTNGGNPIILIPSPKLGDFDVDGKEISFHYRPLKMMNPKGCNTGSPAELTDISWK